MMLNEEEIFRRVANRQLSKAEALELLKQIRQGAQIEQTTEPVQNVSASLPERDVWQGVASVVSSILHLEEGELDADLNFKDLGADSISSVEIVRDLNKQFGLHLDAVVLYDFSTINTLANHLASQLGEKRRPMQSELPPTASVAPTVQNVQNVPAQVHVQTGDTQAKLVQIVSEILHLSEAEINEDLTFRELGVDSISSVEIVRDINKAFGLHLDAVVLYDFGTIESLAEHVAKQAAPHTPVAEAQVVPAPVAQAQAKVAKEPEPMQTVRPSVTREGVQSEEVLNKILGIVGDILHLTESELSVDLSFRELGVDSISSVEIIRDINKAFGLNLDAVKLYDFSTISQVAEHILKEHLGRGIETAPIASEGSNLAVSTSAVEPSPEPAEAMRPAKITLSKKKIADRME